jgi:hypothetical protein
MGYGDERRPARPSLTPLESELRATTATAPRRRRRPFGRLRARYRRLGPPTTRLGALARGVPGLLASFGVGVLLALTLAHWLDRPDPIAFYLVGASLMGLSAGAAGRTSWILGGALVIALGVVLELA